MKRLLLTAGTEAVEAFVNTKPEPWFGLDHATAVRMMLIRFSTDSSRDDVGTSKCMHCVFRRDCLGVPNHCVFVDDRTPMNRLAFEAWEENHRVVYDCGWFVLQDGTMTAVEVKDLGQYIPITRKTWIKRLMPFSCGLSEWHALPKPMETYDDFLKRVKETVERIAGKAGDDDLPPDKELRRIIREMGKADDLKEIYEDDLGFFLDDFWPGKTVEEVVRMYTRKQETTAKEYLSARRKAEKEVNDEPVR